MTMIKKAKECNKITIDLDSRSGGDKDMLLFSAKQLADIHGYDSEQILVDMRSEDFVHLLTVFELNFGHLINLESSDHELINLVTHNVNMHL
jgi:hypothetical protein